MTERNWTELECKKDRAQSFYGKAWVAEVDNMTVLKSYDTEIVAIEKLPDGRVWVLPIMDKDTEVYDENYWMWGMKVGRDISAFSHTTIRHIKEFLYQYAGVEGLSKKEIIKNIWESNEPYIR